MQPTSPEDRDLEKMSSEVSGRYRAGTQDEPSARLDAAIQAAARREVSQSRQRRNWQMPASIAAMLVIGVSLVLIVRDNEPPLPSLERPAADEAKLAKSAPPQLAMKEQSKPRADFFREDRPSRERSARPDREPVVRDEVAAVQENAASLGATAQSASAPAPAAPVVAVPAKAGEAEQARADKSGGFSSANKKDKVLADAATEPRPAVQALRKQEVTAPVQPREWLDEIDGLLRDGKEAEARRQLVAFQQQYPQYPLPERLKALLPAEAAK
jgi:hypothetical protein